MNVGAAEFLEEAIAEVAILIDGFEFACGRLIVSGGTRSGLGRLSHQTRDRY